MSSSTNNFTITSKFVEIYRSSNWIQVPTYQHPKSIRLFSALVASTAWHGEQVKIFCSSWHASNFGWRRINTNNRQLLSKWMRSGTDSSDPIIFVYVIVHSSFVHHLKFVACWLRSGVLSGLLCLYHFHCTEQERGQVAIVKCKACEFQTY